MSDDHVTDREVHVTPFGMLQTSIELLPDGQRIGGLFEVQHDLHGFCWCQPVVEDVFPDGRIYIHRRTLDAPHTETSA